jgi:hypothetical protein
MIKKNSLRCLVIISSMFSVGQCLGGFTRSEDIPVLPQVDSSSLPPAGVLPMHLPMYMGPGDDLELPLALGTVTVIAGSILIARKVNSFYVGHITPILETRELTDEFKRIYGQKYNDIINKRDDLIKKRGDIEEYNAGLQEYNHELQRMHDFSELFSKKLSFCRDLARSGGCENAMLCRKALHSELQTLL